MSAPRLYVIADDQNLHGSPRPLQNLRIRVRRRQWQGGMMSALRGIEVGPRLFVSRQAYDTLSECRRWWIVSATTVGGAYAAVHELAGGNVDLRRRRWYIGERGQVLAHKELNERREPR